MKIEHDLALRMLGAHPLESTRVLERLPAAETARFLAGSGDAPVATCLRAMHGPFAARVLAELEPDRAARIVEALPPDVAAACLRRLEAVQLERLLSRVGTRRARSLRALLRFPPNTAGALMDPDVLALPQDLTVADATARVRAAASEARYNVYTVDREQRLAGVFNLRELLLAEPERTLASIARARPHRLPAEADRHAIVAHPGWRAVHSLPVVDRGGVYLGAIRYRMLRRIEEELRGPGAESGATARALGDLFRTGASSVLEAVAASAPPQRANDAY